MVMLERLFLQAERYALAEDRRRARRDPGECPSRRKQSSPHSLLHGASVWFAKKDTVSFPKTETENVVREK